MNSQTLSRVEPWMVASVAQARPLSKEALGPSSILRSGSRGSKPLPTLLLVAAVGLMVAMLSFYVQLLNQQIVRGEQLRVAQRTGVGQGARFASPGLASSTHGALMISTTTAVGGSTAAKRF